MNKKQIFVLAFLFIFIFTLGVKAATAQPVTIRVGATEIVFFPLVMRSVAAEAPPGVLYVFSSTTTTSGDAGGRDGMGDICPTEDPESHFCSLYEIENAWTTTGVFFHPTFLSSWVDLPLRLGTKQSDVDGYVIDSLWPSMETNCMSWSSDTLGTGTHILGSAAAVSETACSDTLSVACCKQMP